MPDYCVIYGTEEKDFEADDDEAAAREARALIAIAPGTRAFLYREIAVLTGMDANRWMRETPQEWPDDARGDGA
jgi:hypothetical protein